MKEAANRVLISEYLEELALHGDKYEGVGYGDIVNAIYKRDGDSYELNWVSQYARNHPFADKLREMAKNLRN
jgi:hypothetical protein